MHERQIVSTRHTLVGVVAGLDTRTPLSGQPGAMLDPFLILSHHGPQIIAPGSDAPPFGPHPHRGFETVTFIFDGELEYEDESGAPAVLREGGVQWLTAGSGAVHGESAPSDFFRRGGRFEMVQLWVNLPARLKMTPPRQTSLPADAIPSIATADGAGRLALIAGEHDGLAGPINSLTGLFMSSVTLRKGGKASIDVDPRRSVLFYVVRGEVAIGGDVARVGDLAVLGEGDAVAFEAREDALIILAHGDVISEPVVASGPFVMNSHAEITEAWRDYRAGTFVTMTS